MSQTVRLRIESLGSQGEGVASLNGEPVFVPFTLPGETVEALVDGDRAQLASVIVPSADRIAPVCTHFGSCGGCALQHATGSLYGRFKRDQLLHALAARGFNDDSVVAPLISVPPGTRRRANFAATRGGGQGHAVILGYHEGRSHQIFSLLECPVLDPKIVTALPSLNTLMALVLSRRATAELHATVTLQGLDIVVTGGGATMDAPRRAALGGWLAASPGVARLTVDAEQVAGRIAPTVTFGGHVVNLPAASFLQAVPEAEAEIVRQVQAALTGLKPKDRVADLFAGLGAIALPLAEQHQLLAVEWDPEAVAALTAAARGPGLRKIEVLRRDLFREPLSATELADFAAVVFDPPRAGAQAQSTALAASRVPLVVAVSCNPATLARDARTLVEGGYVLERVTPIDQFVYASHVEAVAIFRRPFTKRRA